MADPFGAVVNTITLAQLVHTAVVAFHGAQADEQTLVAQIRLSAVTLDGFVKTLHEAIEADLTREEKTTVADACDILRPEIEKIRDLCVKIGSRESKWIGFGLRVAWVAYRKRQLESLAAQLRHWSSLFNELKGSLPQPRNRMPPYDSSSSGGPPPPSEQVQSLSASFNALAATAATADSQNMRQSTSDVQIRDKLGKLRSATFHGTEILVEYKSYDSGEGAERIAYMEDQIGRLCNFLAYSDPISTGILPSAGWISEPEMYRFGLLFRIPRGYRLLQQDSVHTTSQGGFSTLRSIIARGTPLAADPTRISYAPQHALDERVSTASMIAIALFFVHSYKWVHHDLRTSNVLMLDEKNGQEPGTAARRPSLGRPFLVGFDGARSQDGIYSIGGHDDAASLAEKFADSIFQHPDRQEAGDTTQLRYQMHHDVYSLGVILLEVGLWLPLEKEKSLRTLRNQEFEDPTEKPLRVREALVKLAKEKLAVTVGQRYQSIVVRCLNISVSGSYDLSRFLYEVVWPLWDMKSCLQTFET